MVILLYFYWEISNTFTANDLRMNLLNYETNIREIDLVRGIYILSSTFN